MPNDSPRRVTADELLAQVAWLRELARRLARDASSADDLAQGALVRALEHPPSAGRPLRPWLASVLLSLARRTRRGDRRRADRERRAARSEVVSPNAFLEQFEEQRRLAELVAQLEEPYRTVIIRRFFAGESAAKIARATGKPAASVRSQIARGLVRLRERHGEAHGGDRARSLAALGLATGTGMPFGTPLFGVPSGITSVLAMKTTTKVAAAIALPLLLLTGWFGARGLVAFPGQRGPVEGPRAAELEGDSSKAETARAPAQRPPEDPSRVAVQPVGEVAPSAEPVTPRTAIALRVLDEGGIPIAGALLAFAEGNGDLAGLPASGHSDRDGRIELDVPSEGRSRSFASQEWQTRLTLQASGFATQFFHESVNEGQTTELADRVMASGASIAGRVLAATGAPAIGIEVVAVPGSPTLRDSGWSTGVVFKRSGPMSHEAFTRTRTDEHGLFELAGLPTQPLNLWFRMPDVPWNASETLTLEAREHRDGIELSFPALGPDDQILGRVLRPDGTPAAGARVRTRLGPYWDGDGIEVDANGLFAIVPEDDGAVEMMAYDPTEAFGLSQRVEARRGGSEVTLVLITARRLEVLVLGPDAVPLANVWTRLLIETNATGRRAERTDEHGRTSLLVPGEPFSVRVGASEHIMQDLGPFDPLELPADLVVELERNRIVQGIVLADGKPVPEANVMVMRNIHEMFIATNKGFPEGYSPHGTQVQTDDAGSFRISLDAIGAASWALLIEKEGYARGEAILPSAESAIDDDPIEVELTRGGTLEGRVIVAPSRSSEGVVVALSRFDGRPMIARTSANGLYRVENLAPGPWRVEDRLHTPRGDIMWMGSRGDLKFEPNVTIVEDRTTVFDFDLSWQEDLTLDGWLSFDGVGARGWSARVEEGQGSFESLDLAPVELDAEGRFQAPAQPGPVKLILEAPAEGHVARKLELEVRVDAATQPIVWDFQTASLRGSGESPEARLRVTYGARADGGRYMALFWADKAGHFEITGLPAGPAELMRYEDGVHGIGWYRSTELVLTAGEQTTLE